MSTWIDSRCVLSSLSFLSTKKRDIDSQHFSLFLSNAHSMVPFPSPPTSHKHLVANPLYHISIKPLFYPHSLYPLHHIPALHTRPQKAQSKVVVSTLGEAKFFADHGFCDILYAAPIVPSKLQKIEAILKGEDAKADIHAPSLISRLSQGQVPGLAFPSVFPSNANATSQSTSNATSNASSNRRKSPQELGVSIALLIDSDFGFQVIKSKLTDNQKQIASGLQPVLHPLRLWLDIDGGYHRTGLNYSADSDVALLLKKMASAFVGDSAEFRSASHVHYKSIEEAHLNFTPQSSKESSNASTSTKSSNSSSTTSSTHQSSSQSISNQIQVLLHGLYYHGGNSYGSKSSSEIETYAEKERDAVRGMKEECDAFGLSFGTLAVGSTPTCSQPPANLDPINEFHPGNYIFYDSWQAMIGSCDWEKNASWVLSQVISSYTKPDRIAFDAGALALSKDLGATHMRDQKKESVSEVTQSHITVTGSTHHDASHITSADPPSSNPSSDASNPVPSIPPVLPSNNPSCPSPSAPMSSHPSPLGPASSTTAAPAEFGLLTTHSDVLYLSRITQEMGIIQVRPELTHRDDIQAHKLMKPGQHFRIIPNHSCLSAACFPSLFIVDGDNVIDEWVTAPRIW